MENKLENKNLSDIRIYDLLKIKNPKSFHLKESVRNLLIAMDQVKAAQRDLLCTPFHKNKLLNKEIVNEIGTQLNNVCWNLLSLGEAIGKLQTIKQNAGILTDKALTQLLDELQNGGGDII